MSSLWLAYHYYRLGMASGLAAIDHTEVIGKFVHSLRWQWRSTRLKLSLVFYQAFRATAMLLGIQPKEATNLQRVWLQCLKQGRASPREQQLTR